MAEEFDGTGGDEAGREQDPREEGEAEEKGDAPYPRIEGIEPAEERGTPLGAKTDSFC
jgi:hypothetical protein